jgi:hypothetical protein
MLLDLLLNNNADPLGLFYEPNDQPLDWGDVLGGSVGWN